MNNRNIIGLNLPHSEGCKRREFDAYFTPQWCINSLLNSGVLELTGKRILEPCAGDGAIVDCLRENGLNCTGRDLLDWGRDWGGYDFRDDMTGFDAIISNPPFNLMDKFLVKAVNSAPVVAVLGRTLLVEGKRRYSSLWSVTPPSHILQLPYRVDFSGIGNGKGGAFVLSWFVWNGKKNDGTKFIWL